MKTCLVVDDSRVIRRVASRILEDLDFEVTEAEDGAPALEACRHKMPDVILLASNTANMSCMEFLRNLRKERGPKRPVVVFCTTENDLTQLGDVLGAGANDYLMKPFDKSSLAAKLSEVGVA